MALNEYIDVNYNDYIYIQIHEIYTFVSLQLLNCFSLFKYLCVNPVQGIVVSISLGQVFGIFCKYFFQFRDSFIPGFRKKDL